MEEKDKQNKRKNEKINKISYLQLLSIANKKQKMMMIIGGIAAFLNGIPFPLQTIVLGNVVNSFSGENTVEETMDEIKTLVIYFIIIGFSTLILGWVSMQCWMITGEQLTMEYRIRYFRALTSQDIDWYDEQNTQLLSNKMMDETQKISEAIGEKAPSFIYTLALFIFGISVSFITGWQLALICFCYIPIIAFSTTFYVKQIQGQQKKMEVINKEPLKQAGEAFSSIKTIKCLNSQEYEKNIYFEMLKKTYNLTRKYSVYVGLSFGLIWFAALSNYGYGFWFGSILVEHKVENHLLDRSYNGGDVLTIFLSVMWGSIRLGQAIPYLKSFAQGQQAGYEVYQILNSKPQIQVNKNNNRNIDKQLKQNAIEGNISFKNVEFAYKSNQDKKVLNKISFDINKGENIAIVGESGCGKTTISMLLQRFYDINQGEILIDDINLKDIDLNWYRQNVGLIGQQPILFATSIRENVRYGKYDASEDEILGALKIANAYDFVMNLENKLDTFVGNQGASQLSGGQKQRIAIARAVLKNPQILILDEATSALDRQNEKSIQNTICQLFQGKTIITIAHRLKTIQNCDKIFVIDKGEVVQQGKYNDLINCEGYLQKMIKNQDSQDNESQNNNKICNLEQSKQNSDEKLQTLKESDIYQDTQQNIETLQTDHQLKGYQFKFLKNNNQKNIDTIELQNKEPKINFTLQEIKNKQMQEQQYKKQTEKQIKNRVFSYSRGSTLISILAGLMSIIAGSCFSVMTVFLIRMIEVLIKIDVMEQSEFRKESNINCLMIIVVSITIYLSNSFQSILWNKVGLNLTDKLRKLVFVKILNMKMSWYDKKENNVFKLQKIITHDTLSANSIVSTQINTKLQICSSLLSGIIIAFFHDWRTSLVGLIAIPLIFISSMIQNAQAKGFGEKTSQMHKESGSCVQECIFQIKTIYSYTCQQVFENSYYQKLQNVYKLVPKQSWKLGFSFGFSQMLTNFIYAILFYFGSQFYQDHGVSAKDMLTSIFVLMYSSFSAGTQLQFVSGVGDSIASAKNIFDILDEEDEIQEQVNQMQGVKLLQEGKIQGKIEFKNVTFKYPSREQLVLKNVSFCVYPGQKVALVGESGCGKSTIVQILAKLYPISYGSIYIDDIDIDNYSLKYLRSIFGVVSQDSDLFSGSIYKNIKYNTTTQNEEDIIKVSELSQVHNFVVQNKDKQQKNSEQVEIKIYKEYQEIVQQYKEFDIGEKGSKLSGGQKQRVTIARALLRESNVLVLDEATSALDMENEQIITQNIDKVRQNKTQIVIAHRIPTISNSEQILVLSQGQIVEQGTYSQLKQKKGYFYNLENGQKKQ